MSSTATARVLALVALLTLVGIAPAQAVSTSSYEKQVVKATNAYRAGHDKVAVKHQNCVDRWAESQARWMAKNRVLQHREGRLRKILKDCKLTGASENIAWNFSSGNKAVAAWKKSSGHAANMRASQMRYIGVGAVKDSRGEWWVAQVFGTRK
ncbi:MAG: CAP domain-containing protein [Aeromicrobium sp.]